MTHTTTPLIEKMARDAKERIHRSLGQKAYHAKLAVMRFARQGGKQA